jgi:5-methylcytosine-specific restriction protein A
MTERIRGRRGMKLRAQRLAAEPLCRDCKAEDKVTLAVVPDHIKPLAMGGTDTDDNIRCLCAEHHRIRTAEQFGHDAHPPKLRRQWGADGWPI